MIGRGLEGFSDAISRIAFNIKRAIFHVTLKPLRNNKLAFLFLLTLRFIGAIPMQNKYLRSTIIVTVQCILPALLLFIIAPLLINHTAGLIQLQRYIQDHQIALLLTHGLFYLTTFCIWPHFIKRIISRQNDCPDTTRIKIATSARWYLVAAIVFFECLVYWS